MNEKEAISLIDAIWLGFELQCKNNSENFKD